MKNSNQLIGDQAIRSWIKGAGMRGKSLQTPFRENNAEMKFKTKVRDSI
ncbi:MAG: hypothetical protein PVF83_15440 [Anaerolineales bacterium]|jgi:hypothetical protein